MQCLLKYDASIVLNLKAFTEKLNKYALQNLLRISVFFVYYKHSYTHSSILE